jgi:hypothetical protein
MNISVELREQIAQAILASRENFEGNDGAYSRRLGINNAVFNRIKNGEREGLLAPAKWLNIARELDVKTGARRWNTVRTVVYDALESDILFCKNNSKSIMFIDDCGLGKSYIARHLSRTLQNCFYIDGSQCKSEPELIRAIGRAVGVGDTGKLSEIRANTKYYLKSLTAPVVIIDEAGDLTYSAFMLLKEYWNATEFACGWAMFSADGLRKKMETRIHCQVVGYAEMFSRFSEKYNRITPVISGDRTAFYRKLLTDVLRPNMTGPDELYDTGARKIKRIDHLVSRCLATDETGRIGGLRRAESLVILHGWQLQ